LDHAVEHCDSDGRFALLSGKHASAELGADEVFVAADGRLDETAATIAGRALPPHAALLGKDGDVTVTRCLLLTLVCAQYGAGTWRNDDVWRPIMLTSNGRSIDLLIIVGAVCGNTANHTLGLPEQGRRPSRVIGMTLGQQMGGDLACDGIDGDMKLGLMRWMLPDGIDVPKWRC
jgi:hypothetical protein